MNLSTDQLAIYRQTARQRWQQEQSAKIARREIAWEVARQAAALLKEQFGATAVRVFGSVAHGQWFSDTSDIDLAVWGIEGSDYYLAVARLQDISPDFTIDLIAMEDCPPPLYDKIVREGQPL